MLSRWIHALQAFPLLPWKKSWCHGEILAPTIHMWPNLKPACPAEILIIAHLQEQMLYFQQVMHSQMEAIISWVINSQPTVALVLTAKKATCPPMAVSTTPVLRGASRPLLGCSIGGRLSSLVPPRVLCSNV